MLNRRVRLLTFSMLVLGAGSACAQGFPNKPIRLFAGALGGAPDIEARLIANGISGPLGQQAIVDNRGTTVSPELVAGSPPDGYNLLLISNPFFVAPLLQAMNYDAVRDFAPVTLVSREPNILVVHPSLPVKSVKDLIALARAKPGVLEYASGSTGSSTHLAGELFRYMAGLRILRVPYKGGGQAVIDLIGGQVQTMFATPASVAGHVKTGKLRAVAVTSAQPSALHPGLPTVAASGLPGYEFTGLDGVYAPAKTPAAVISRLNQEIVRYLRSADAKEKFLRAGIEIVAGSPEELAAAMQSDIAKLSKLIKDAGIKAE